MTCLDNFLCFLDSLPDPLIYSLLCLSAFVENIFPPIPGDTFTAFGAFLVGTKRLHPFGVYISTTLGSFSGFMFLFWVGSLLGRRYFIERDYRFFKAQDIIRAEEWFRKYGYLLILFNRFLPGIRSVISLAGGISGLKIFKVAALALISSCAWNTIWISLGSVVGNNWETVRAKMTYVMLRYNLTILALLGLVILIFALKRTIKRRRS